uniref:SNF2 N-terminal domain-containing protein n=1 Tax=Panagrolaimus sp. JU765 TaxID=591449 RepID=A0AC34QS86_9BILA
MPASITFNSVPQVIIVPGQDFSLNVSGQMPSDLSGNNVKEINPLPMMEVEKIPPKTNEPAKSENVDALVLKDQVFTQGLKTVLTNHQTMALTWILIRENSFDRRGGVLADELGKPLSILALILAQKNSREFSDEINQQRTKAMEKRFENEKNLFPAFSTLIIAHDPLTWKNAIKKHVEPGKLKSDVFIGAQKEEKPNVLGKNDVVITTYRIVISDVKKEKSVLTKIGWERIIFDQADATKDRRNTYDASCQFSALARWAVSTDHSLRNLAFGQDDDQPFC